MEDCPHPDCVPDSLSWADITRPDQVQQGCSNSFGFGFSSSYWCLTRAAASRPTTQIVEGVVQVETWPPETFKECQPWSDTEPCHHKQRVITGNPGTNAGSTFTLVNKECNGEKGVGIELVDISQGLNKTGLNLFHLALTNYPVELRDTVKCFRTKKNLCGPGSLSFFSKEKNLVLTNCDGVLTMREEYDSCG